MGLEVLSRNPNPTPATMTPSERSRKRLPTRPKYPSMPAVHKPAHIVMGPVKILKRGEEMPKTTVHPPPPQKSQTRKVPGQKKSEVPDLGSTKRLGPNPERVPKQTKLAEPNLAAAFYAGSSSCIASPPPSSLPLPSFFAKKSCASSTDEAASELLKLLRLNLS